MIKQLVKDSAIYTVSNILLKGISFFLLPFYTRVLTPSDYGVIDILATVISLLSVTICVEITQAVGRFLPEYSERKILKLTIARTGLWFSIFMNFIFMLLFVFFARQIGWLLFNSDKFNLVIKLTGINLLVYGTLYAIQNQIRWQLMARVNTQISLFTTLAIILSTLFFVLQLKLGVVGVILGQVAGSLFGLLYSLFYVIDTLLPQINFRYLKKMLKYSYPLVFSATGVILSQYVDRISLNYFLGIEEVGLYGVAFRIANTISLLFAGFSATLTPMIIVHYKKDETPAQIARIFGYFFSISILVILMLSLFSDLIMTYFVSSTYFKAIFVMPYILFSVVFNGAYIFAPGLNIAGKTKLITYINLSALLVNLILNIILLPLIGYIGAGIATLCASCFLIFSLMYFSNKEYKIPYSLAKIIFVLVPTFLLSVIFQYLNTDIVIETSLKILIMAVVSFYLYYLRFVSFSDFLLLKERFLIKRGR